MVGVTIAARASDALEDGDERHSIHSVASTVNTVTSLNTRIRDLTLAGFEDKLEPPRASSEVDRCGLGASPLAEGSEEEADGNGSEPAPPAPSVLSEEDFAAVPRSLQLQPLQVCCRLFDRRSHPPLPLKRLSMAQVEDFRQHGYVVLDNLLSKDAAARIKAEALRLSHRGLLQPVPASHLGVLSHGSTGTAAHASAAPQHHAAGGALSCSPCSSHSSLSLQGGAANGVASPPHQQAPQPRWGELRLPLQLGQPPADTAVFAPVLAALQDLQDDLAEFVRLRSRGAADYCLCHLPAAAPAVPRHRDALPDDGRRERLEEASRRDGSSNGTTAPGPSCQQPPPPPQQQQPQQPPQQQRQQQSPQPQPHAGEAGTAAATAAAAGPTHGGGGCGGGGSTGSSSLGPQARRVSVLVFLNPDWDREGGGGLRLWPPQRPVGPPSATAASAAARRSPTSSDAGTTFSELSDCGSLRMPPFLGSTTSSVIAEASAPDHDTYSLDGLSVAESEVERLGFEWVESEEGGMALDVAPLAGRVILLLSGAVEHALLPGGGRGAAGENVFVRAWCS